MLLDLDEIPDVPIDPAALSRDPAVGAAYEDDPLVWHGPFKRPTLEAFVRGLAAIADGPGARRRCPPLWIHGEDDQLVPLAATPAGDRDLARRATSPSGIYPGARHEVFNETNRDEVLDDVVAFIRDALRK